MKEEKKNPDLSPINQSSMKHIVVFLPCGSPFAVRPATGPELSALIYAGPNGPGAVNAMAVYDDVLYLGGNFTSIEGEQPATSGRDRPEDRPGPGLEGDAEPTGQGHHCSGWGCTSGDIHRCQWHGPQQPGRWTWGTGQ